MAEQQEQQNQADPVSVKIRDLEEKHRILKDRVLLTGQNLVEMKEKHQEETKQIKKDIDNIKEDIEKIKSFMDSLSEETNKFAKKEDLEVLQKQAKMFQPLEEYMEKNKNQS